MSQLASDTELNAKALGHLGKVATDIADLFKKKK